MTLFQFFWYQQDVEELMSLPPDKILLRWMNFQLRKTEYKKTVTNFSSDVKVTNNIKLYKFSSWLVYMISFLVSAL